MIKYLTETNAREAIIDVGRRIYDRGFVAANDRNISCRISEDEIIVTPTGVSKGFMEPGELVKMKLDGTIIGENKPSSEVKMHLRVYKENPDITGVVHAHPACATSYSVLGLELTHPVVAEGVLVTGNIHIAPYAKPGSMDVPNGIAPYVNQYNGVLLANHGALTWGTDLYQALYRMEALEHQAQIQTWSLLLANATGRSVQYIRGKDAEDLVDIRNSMGIHTGGVPEY